MSGPDSSVRPGVTFNYYISYENIGDAPATNTVIVNTIDDRVNLEFCQGEGLYEPVSQSITWNLETIEPQESGAVFLIVKAQSEIPHGDEIINTTSISCAEGIVSDTMLTTTVMYIPILTIAKTTLTDVAYSGKEIVYEIEYSNTGDTSATGTILTDYLPDQTNFISCTRGGTLDSLEKMVLWRLGDLQPSRPSNLHLVVQIDSTFSGGGTIVNRVIISSVEGAFDEGLCTTRIDTTVLPLDEPVFSLSIKGLDSFIQSGEEMFYRIECENTGRGMAHSVVITDSIPNHTEYLTCSDDGQYDAASEKVTWTIKELEGHQERIVTLTVQVKCPLPDRTQIINRGSVTCSEGLSVSAAETTVVLSAPVWNLITMATPSEAVRGRTVDFTTQVNNIGNMNAINTIIINPISDYLTYSRNVGGGIYDAEENSVTWNLGSVNVNEEIVVSLAVEVATDFPTNETVTNWVYVQSNESADSVSISLPLVLSKTYKLHQNHPNPFNQKTTISYQLSEDVSVLLTVYSILGQEIRTLVDKPQMAGHYSITWDGKDNQGRVTPTGVYYYRLVTEKYRNVRKMVMLR